MNTLVNILIRHREGRQRGLENLLKSIHKQSYRNFRVIISVDFPRPDYIPDWCEVIDVSADQSIECFYNLYCNDLKAMVTDGWFIFIDDDDHLDRANSLSLLAAELYNEHQAVIFPFKRAGKKKPMAIDVRFGPVSGKIGLPCIALHHSKKNVADVQSGDNGDYKFIKKITMNMYWRFVDIVVVSSPKRNFGK